MRGDLRQSSLAEVMRHLYAERKDGILFLSQGDVRRRIHFKKGAPVFADADDGQLPNHDDALSLLYSLFAWTAGTFAFENLEPNVDDAHAFTLSPSVVILEGSRSVREAQVLEHLTGGPQRVFACTQTSELPLFTMKLSSAESAILKFARERQRFTAQDLPFKSSGLIVVNALNALLSVGLLEVVEKASVGGPEPAPASSVVAPTPEPPVTPPPPTTSSEQVVSERSEVESLLDTFQSKRREMPASSSKVDWDPPSSSPAIEAAGASEEQTPLATQAPPSPSVAVPEQTVAPVAPPSPQPPAAVETSLSALIGRWIPAGRAGRVVSAAVASAALVGLGVLWLTSRDDEPSTPSAVAVADSTPRGVEEMAPDPQPREPDLDPDPEPGAEPERSEAELFYSANLAFENGEYERSKAELSVLLERRPDFKAARELVARVDRELEPEPPAPERSRAPRRVVEKPPVPEAKPTLKPETEPARPAAPDPATLFDGARQAFARGDLRASGAKLDELEALDPTYPGARTLREQLVAGLWERKLPIVLSVRHDHALGGCDGVLTLTKTGYGYRSKEHEWIWSFGEVLEAVRRESNRLRIETGAGASFNFDLRDGLSDDDWVRHRALSDR